MKVLNSKGTNRVQNCNKSIQIAKYIMSDNRIKKLYNTFFKVLS